MKLVLSRELAAQRLISRLLPDVTPEVLSAELASNSEVPSPASQWRMQTRWICDTAASAAEPISVRERMRRAVCQVARVHVALRAVPAVRTLELPGPPEIDAVTSGLETLELAFTSALVGAPALAALIPQLRLALPGYLAMLCDSTRWTLVHGDLHPGNVVLDASGHAWLIDWGSACLQVPGWDLVFCDAALLRAYCDRLAALDRHRSLPFDPMLLRAAKVVRLCGSALTLARVAVHEQALQRAKRAAIRTCLWTSWQAHSAPA